MNTCDYYKILRVDPDVTQKDLKESYLKLCKELHPDVNRQDSAERKFKLVQEAYRVLSDETTRAKYNISRASPLRTPKYPVEVRKSGIVRTGLHTLNSFEGALAKRGGWFFLALTPIMLIGFVGMSTLSSDVTKYDDSPKLVRAYYCTDNGKWIKPDVQNFHKIGRGQKLHLIPESQVSSR